MSAFQRHDTAIEAYKQREQECHADDWPEPTPLVDNLEPVEQFSPIMVPEALRPWIEDVADRYQCPPDFIAAPALVGIASLIGRQLSIRPKAYDTWTVIPNLWGGIVGGPGLMKTSCLQEGLAGVYDIDKRLKDAHKRATAAAKDPGKKEVDLPRKRVVVNDATVEALSEILLANPNGVLLARDEIMGFIASLSKKGAEGARQFYLEAWNGDGQYSFERITRKAGDIDGMRVSIVGGIQPGPLCRHIADACRGGEGADGFLQRFQLLVYPDPPTRWSNVDREPNSSAQDAFLRAHHRVAVLDPALRAAAVKRGEHGSQLPYVRFDPEAQTLFNQYREQQEALIRSTAADPAMQGHFAKYRSLVPALALANAVLDKPIGKPVGIDQLARAGAYVRYLESHARRIYTMGRRGSIEHANALWKRLSAGDIESPFSARDVYRKHWSGLGTTEVHSAIEALERHAWIRPLRTVSGQGTLYAANPGVGLSLVKQ